MEAEELTSGFTIIVSGTGIPKAIFGQCRHEVSSNIRAAVPTVVVLLFDAAKGVCSSSSLRALPTSHLARPPAPWFCCLEMMTLQEDPLPRVRREEALVPATLVCFNQLV